MLSVFKGLARFDKDQYIQPVFPTLFAHQFRVYCSPVRIQSLPSIVPTSLFPSLANTTILVYPFLLYSIRLPVPFTSMPLPDRDVSLAKANSRESKQDGKPAEFPIRAGTGYSLYSTMQKKRLPRTRLSCRA